MNMNGHVTTALLALVTLGAGNVFAADWFFTQKKTGTYELDDGANWKYNDVTGNVPVYNTDKTNAEAAKIQPSQGESIVLNYKEGTSSFAFYRLHFDSAGDAHLNLGAGNVLTFKDTVAWGGVGTIWLDSGVISNDTVNSGSVGSWNGCPGRFVVNGENSALHAHQILFPHSGNDMFVCITNGASAKVARLFSVGSWTRTNAANNGILVSGEGSLLETTGRSILHDQRRYADTPDLAYDWTLRINDGGVVTNFTGTIGKNGPNCKVVVDNGVFHVRESVTFGGLYNELDNAAYITNNSCEVMNGGMFVVEKKLTVGESGSKNYVAVGSRSLLTVPNDTIVISGKGSGNYIHVHDGGRIEHGTREKPKQFYLGDKDSWDACLRIEDGGSVTTGDLWFGNAAQNGVDEAGAPIDYNNTVFVGTDGVLTLTGELKLYGNGNCMVISNGTFNSGASWRTVYENNAAKGGNTRIVFAGTKPQVTAQKAYLRLNAKFTFNVDAEGYQTVPLSVTNDLEFDGTCTAEYDVAKYRRAGGGTLTLMKSANKEIVIGEAQLAKLRETLPEGCKLILSDDEKELKLRVAGQGVVVIIR